MALLGKLLKGRSTKNAQQQAMRNIRIRAQNRTQEEYENEKKMALIRKNALKNSLAEEQKLIAYNRKKLLTNWRNIMRIAKTEQLKNDIEIISQNNQREIDSKEAFIQMLDKNLDEADDQYQIALRNHLIHLDQLIALQDSRLESMHAEFDRDCKILEEEFDREREEINNIHRNQVRQLDDMIETVKEDDKKKTEDARNEFQAFCEEIKHKNLDELNTIKFQLEGKQRKLHSDLEQMYEKYKNDTHSKAKDHAEYFQKDRDKTKEIDRLAKEIERLKDKIEHMKHKIHQHTKEYNKRNLALKRENENIHRNYKELKAKMLKFREDEARRLTELTLNSRNAVLKLKEFVTLGERILKTAELCRRLETEKEKVIPFYEGTVIEEEIPADIRKEFEEISGDKYQEYSYLNNFYKRYNKVLLDKLAIHKQKEQLDKDNTILKSMLKQYLDGISLNDDVLKNMNPLLVVNNKIKINKLPVEKLEGNQTIVEGNEVVANYRLQNS
jgi:hypothetical protein